MHSKLLEFIEKEKEISIYKLQMLNHGSDKAYKKRIARKEQDFIDFPFHELSISSMDELKSAIDLFRDNKEEFHKRWKPVDSSISDIDLKQIILNKIDFFEKIFSSLIEDGIRQANIVQNLPLRDWLKAPLIGDKDCGLDTISRLEGIRVAKKRARIQILIYCLARYINSYIKGVKNSLLKDNLDLKEINNNLSIFIENYQDSIFSYYNFGIKEVPMIINGTMGNNAHIPSIYPLINYCDSIDNQYLPISKDSQIKVLLENGKPLPKKLSERAFSAKLPMNRVGNEWVTILYCEIYSRYGTNISSIINYKDFYNFPKNNGYIKAIPTFPIWELIKDKNSSIMNEVIKSLEINLEKNSTLVETVNNSSGSIKIDCKKSLILMPATRSEADHINDASEWIKSLVVKIIDDYKSIDWINYNY